MKKMKQRMGRLSSAPKMITRIPSHIGSASMDAANKMKYRCYQDISPQRHHNHITNITRLIKIKRKLQLGLQSARPDDHDSAARQALFTGESSDGGGSRREGGSRVPKGFLAVYVGPELRRFVIPISFLTMPDFMVLMERMADEFGCENHGALQIPCEEEDFEQILNTCYRIMSSKKTSTNI